MMAHVVDRISQLPEALILRILSALPTAKDVVATMVLSRRWHSLWKRVPKLVYNDSYKNINIGKFSRFVDRSLILHDAPVETLHFNLIRSSVIVDIGIWITIAAKCRVRDLSIDIDCSSSTTPVKLPSSLYTGSRMLVSLKLKRVTLTHDYSLSFPTLKTLSLLSVKYYSDEFVKRFLSSCHVLEDLVVEQCLNDNVTVFTVNVPSLKSASLFKSSERCIKDGGGYVIDAASLEYLVISDYSDGFCVTESDMPNLVKADVVVTHSTPTEILSSITSAKRLYLCLPYSKDDGYPVGSVFHRLEHLEMGTCETDWLNLLMCVLRDSPKLRSLKLKQCHDIDARKRPCWNEPSSVPDCLLSSLQTLEWVKYEGTEEEKEVALFILRSGSCLKKVTIFSKATSSDKKLVMLKELSLSFRRSPTCQLEFH